MPENVVFTPPEKTQAANPLANYFRQPKIYLKLPSKGQFYPEGALDRSEIGEYAVYAMTAKDELMFKTPDALLNGQATVEIIKSCIPSIKNPWKMPSVDVDAALVAIRIATYGESMDVRANCPSCNAENEYAFRLTTYLEMLNAFEFQGQVSLGPLAINIRPYDYQEVTKSTIKAIEQRRIFDVINDENLSDEEKLDKFGTSFVKLTALTVDVIAGCIESIITPEGTVTDRTMIKEFIDNAPTDVFNSINEHVLEMKNQLDMKAQHVSCNECQTEFDVTITMDQSNFFAVRS
jgi:hypothetical protein